MSSRKISAPTGMRKTAKKAKNPKAAKSSRGQASEKALYTVINYTTDVRHCEECGKEEGLKGTFIVVGPRSVKTVDVKDRQGNVVRQRERHLLGRVRHLGSQCASKLTGSNTQVGSDPKTSTRWKQQSAEERQADVQRLLQAMVTREENDPYLLRTTLAPIESSAKIRKTAKYFKDAVPAIMYFAPASVSGQNVCPHSSPGCVKSCLNLSGKGILDHAQLARIRKTAAFFDNNKAFMEGLEDELDGLIRNARKKNKHAVIRLNGTSDIAWEDYIKDPKYLKHMYDYTKSVDRWRKQPYPLTLSWNEKMDRSPLELAQEAKREGRPGIAVVVAPEVLERLVEAGEYKGVPVVDGTKHDYRTVDPPGALVLLKPIALAQDELLGSPLLAEDGKAGFVLHSEKELEHIGRAVKLATLGKKDH
jgi:hypothetical protein